MRQYLGLAIGLVVGVVGAVLFMQSLPPEEGSVAEQLEETDMELRKARRKLAALGADNADGRPRRTVRASCTWT